MVNIKFTERRKHGRMDFHPGVSYSFDDPDAVPYFSEALGWAQPTDDESQVHVTLGEIDIDPLTKWGTGPLKGEYVMPARAQAILNG